MTAVLFCALALPAGYRPGDILAFHRRDALQVTECVAGSSLRKGLLWGGLPACLSLRFLPGQVEAELAIDGQVPAASQALFQAMASRILCLSQDVEAFERQHRSHPQLGVLIARQAGLRVPVAATPFEALTWAVTAQQISVNAAISLRRRLIAAVGTRHSAGLLCHPSAQQIAALSVETLRQAGFSTAKANTLLELSKMVAQSRLPLDAWLGALPVEAIRARLLAVRGVGPWTVDYTLLRGFGWLDGSLHGDAGVRRGLQRLLGMAEAPDQEYVRRWLAEFTPWRALVAGHLWAMQSNGA